ncbi:MAG: LacI family transcriptional regulator, repressor for deo operon, udp, cdd, tsx, nupC, and nupG [Chthoniobacter sp.]|nr:LacI family transcriptional regulator, repressor for deo operon, udp, cdd, tsx, nupC, and nupG [Chthoniobacter sp.]
MRRPVLITYADMNLPNEANSSAPGEATGGETRSPKTLGDLHKTITMAQIAKAAGVSQGAISSLLNDRDYGIRVSEKTRERVFKVCREMGYIPNDLRAVVRMYPELGDYCLLLSQAITGGLTDPYAARVAAGVMAGVLEPSNPLTLAFYDATRDYFSEPASLPHPVRTGVCSKFLCLGPANPALFKAMSQRGSPVVSLGHEARVPGVLSLVPDYAQASRLAIEHLFELGHKQIAILSGPFGATDPQLLELNRGVRQACDEFGLPIEASNIVYGDLSEKAGRAAVDELFARKLAPTAIFCLSDTAAIGVLAAAAARGIKVPEQLSVVGCGDDPCAQATTPPLTTLHLPVEEMARLGVKEIERMVRETLAPEPKKVLLPVGLLQRGSTGAPKKS